jgi:hypothetical protein
MSGATSGRDLARAALVGVGSRGETGKIILLSGQNVENIQNFFRPKAVLQGCSVNSVSEVIIISLDRDIVQPLTELTKKEQRFEWV